MSRAPDLRRAERMALRVLAARRITTLPIDPLSLLRACRDTTVLTIVKAAEWLEQPEDALERLFGSADAVTLRCHQEGKEQYIVIYRPGGNPARLRFTLAHELGHRLLCHDGTEPAEEREADHFASHLLCPEPVVASLRARFGTLPLHRAAVEFYVSRTCAGMLARRPESTVEATLLQQVTAQLSSASERACSKGE